jgi:YHS domain-containing protein
MKRIILCGVIVFLLTLVIQSFAQPSLNVEAQKQMILSNLSSMPLSFTENRGQWNEKALFKTEAGGATFWFCSDEVAYVFARNTNKLIDDGMSHDPDMPKGMPDKFNHPQYKKESMVLYAKFVGTSADPQVIAENRLGYNCNYFYGNDPSKWATDVPNYSSITYKNIYPGIDLKYHGNGQGMKYDFIVNPGADISQIQIKYEGVKNLGVTNQGDLEARTIFGPVYERIPQIYQETDGIKRQISGRYELDGSGIFGFAIDGDYDDDLPLIIDPELVYSSYFGGSGDEIGYSIAADYGGYLYITGYTSSSDFPLANPYDGSLGQMDAFVSKLTPSGNSIVYSTFLGGSSGEWGRAITVDGSGNAYVAGFTYSSDFPTLNPYDASFNGIQDIFVTKLSAAGNALVYSTYLGGTDEEDPSAICVDDLGRAYVTGYTSSTNFPTQNPYDGSMNGGYDDAFVTKLAAAGNSLVFSTYLGGSGDDGGSDIAIDASYNAYIIGSTTSANFPTSNAYDPSLNGGYDVFVTKLAVGGTSLIYSTYIGGADADYSSDINVDNTGAAYLAGSTYSSDFPTVNAYDNSYADSMDCFIAKLSASGLSLLFSTYLGGISYDYASGIGIGSAGNIFIIATTRSTDIPILHAYDPSYNGSYDGYVAELSPSGNSLLYGTYLGGNNMEGLTSCCINYEGSICIIGMTTSSDFPVVNPYDASYNGGQDVLLAIFESGGCQYAPGDINGNGAVNGVDIVYGVNYLKGTGPHPPIDCSGICDEPSPFYAAGDVNGNCAFNGIDITYFVRYLKGQVSILQYCSDCPPGR